MAKVGPAEAALAPARAKEEGTGQTCVKVCSWDQRAGTSELGTTRSQGSCAASAMTTARPCLQALWAKASRIFLRQGLNKNAATYPGHELRVRLNVGGANAAAQAILKLGHGKLQRWRHFTKRTHYHMFFCETVRKYPVQSTYARNWDYLIFGLRFEGMSHGCSVSAVGKRLGARAVFQFSIY